MQNLKQIGIPVVVISLLSIFFLQCAGDIKGVQGDPGKMPSITIRGGGKISWDATTFKVSFTEDFSMIDHATGVTTAVSTSASPVTLGSVNHIGYVALNTASGQSAVTRVDVAETGSAPTGSLVLFQRTTDDTLWIPSVQKEILQGDHWQFGTGLSWFERMASSRKPSFSSNIADSTQVLVQGSTAAPAVVHIDGKIYANTSDATLDLDPPVGRGGLDTGTKDAHTAYYLYAIPATTGRTFDLVASLIAPTETGPAGYSSWSYIGAFSTARITSAITNFKSSNGTTIFVSEVGIKDSTADTLSTAVVYENMPVTTKQAYFQMTIVGSFPSGAGFLSGVSTLPDSLAVVLPGSTTVNFFWGWAAIFTPKTVYIQSNNAANTFSPELYGWMEDPMQYP